MISVTWPQVQWSPSLQLRAFVCVEVARFEQRFDINFDAVLACSEARSRMRSDQPKRASFSVARKADVDVTRGILQRLVRDR